jgi:Arc/MetJ-type ribon-helix-helix transcriptional regulator
MDGGSERITIRLSGRVLDRLDRFVALNDLESRSDVIREAIEGFLDAHDGEGTGERKVDLPGRSWKALQKLVDVGDFETEEEAARAAIREFISIRTRQLVELDRNIRDLGVVLE